MPLVRPVRLLVRETETDQRCDEQDAVETCEPAIGKGPPPRDLETGGLALFTAFNISASEEYRCKSRLDALGAMDDVIPARLLHP